jgi:hypothetical protein
MQERTIRRLLWAAALVMAPFPILALGPGSVPPLHHLELGLLSLAFAALERTGGVVISLATLFLLQGVAFGALCWLAAALAAKLLARLGPLARTRIASGAVVLALAITVSHPVYDTPFSSRSAHSTLLGVYW